MSLIQKEVIEIYRNNPELLEDNQHKPLYIQRIKLHKKFLLFLSKLSYKINYSNKNYKMLIKMFEIIHLFDIELVVKMAVQFNLWGETIYKLGTDKHMHYIKKTETLDILGCFAMTEIGHGSNIIKLETTAKYNHSKRQFIINTPFYSSRKYWIGQGAIYAHYAIVFASLYIEDICYGVHPFIVQLRNQNNECMENITIKDCGIKNGLNGIDNGEIIFDNIVVPYDNLLDKFAYINNKGKYVAIKGRLSKMLSELSKNRLGMGLGSNIVSRYALKETLLYAIKRKQFGKIEHSLISYKSYQHRIIPLLAKSYVNSLFNDYAINNLDDITITHFNSIISKTACSWNALDTLQECREGCGGHGYHYKSYFGKMYKNLDIYTTFEGDNNVLLQQIMQIKLKEYKKDFSKLQFIKYKLRKYINYFNYFIPNIIGAVYDDFNIQSFLKYLNYRIDYKIISILLVLKEQHKKHIDIEIVWNSLQYSITELSKLISFSKRFEIGCKSINKNNIALFKIFMLHHIKYSGIQYIINNDISNKVLKNIDILLEENYLIVIKNIYTYINLLNIPDINNIKQNHLCVMHSML